MIVVLILFILLFSGLYLAERSKNTNLNTLNLNLGKNLIDVSCAKFDLEAQIPLIIKEEREKALKSSHAVVRGKVSEEIAPLLPKFPYVKSDLKILLSPVDYVVFDGMSKNQIENIIFLEIKSGEAGLSERQKQIEQCIKKGKVEFYTFRA